MVSLGWHQHEEEFEMNTIALDGIINDRKFNSCDYREIGAALSAVEDSEDERMAALDNVFGRDADFRKQCALQFTLGVAQATIAGKNMEIEILKRQLERADEAALRAPD